MEVKLIVCGGRHAGKELPVPPPKFLIGRAEDCHLRPASDMVSRHHCAILVEEGMALVRDCDSRNGTFVNDVQIEGERELKNGDHLKIGPLEFEVQLSVQVGGKKKPKVHSVQEAAARTVQNAGGQTNTEADIDRLMNEEDAAATRTSNAEETTIRPAPSPAPAAPTPKPQWQPPVSPQAEPQPPEKFSLTGRFAEQKKKPTAANSREAAAEMLRKMMGGK
jgi:predicted component of type VI protein secretion system